MSNSLSLFCPNRKPFAIPSYIHSHLIYAEQKLKNHAHYTVSVFVELLLCTVEELHASWITHSPFILFKTQWGFEAYKNRELWWYLSIREATLSCMLIHTHTHFRPFSSETTVLLSRARRGSVPQSAAGWWSGTDTESLASVSPMLPFASMCEGLFPICQACPGTRQGWRGPAGPLLVLCKHTCASPLSDRLCKTRTGLKTSVWTCCSL